MYESILHGAEVAPDYKASLEAVIARPLTVENIDTYAEQALSDLIGLINEVSTTYTRQPTHSFANAKDIENAAFSYFGLSRVEEILDHIADKAEELVKLDETIAHTKVIDNIIVPPDYLEVPEPTGEGELHQKRTLPRLKTMLFILANDFDVDVNDEDQLTKTKGILPQTTMRSSSYYMLEVHKLDRTVLVCDEVGNVTYVIDNVLLQQIGLQKDRLLELTKNQINALLEEISQLGQRVVYSENFVPNIIAALENPSVADPQTNPNSGIYLHPKAPDGILSMAGIAREFGLASGTVKKAILELDDSLGEAASYKFGPRVAAGFLPEQQELIRRYLSEKGYFETPPEGYLNEFGISQKFSLSNHVIHRAVAELGDRIGEVRAFKSDRRATRYFSPEQQDLIIQQLNEDGLFAEDAPADHLTILEMAKSIGLTNTVVENAIVSVRSELGELYIYNFNGQRVRGLSPIQQGVLRRHFEQNGFFAEKAPADILNVNGLVDKFGVGIKALTRAIESLGDSLGEVKEYRFKGLTAQAYSPEQQKLIFEFLKQHNYLSPDLPDGYLSLKGLTELLDTSYGTLAKAQEALGDRLGPVKIYKTGNKRPTNGYSPKQQEMIRGYLEAQGFFDSPPEDYLTINKMSDSLHLSRTLITAVVDELGEKLGEVREYRFGGSRAAAFSPKQQEMIRDYLAGMGHLGNVAPEGYKTATKMSDEWGIKYTRIAKAILDLEEELGEAKHYKFKSRIAVGYSPTQQEIIFRHLHQQ
jgi:hypothetical protein